MSVPSPDENRARLRECVGDGTVLPFAIIGTDPVCVWNQTGNSNALCDQSSEQFPCPSPPRRDTNDNPTCAGVPYPPTGTTIPELVDKYVPPNTPPAEVEAKAINVKLGLVPSGTGYRSADPCVDLRKLRHGLGSREEICQRLSWSLENLDGGFIGYYDDEEAAFVDDLSAQYTFDTSKGSRLQFLQNDIVRWNTAGTYAADGTTKVWPCAAHQFATASECATVPNSLVCQPVNCDATTNAADLQKLASLHQRLAEATVLLKGLSHMDFNKVKVPALVGAAELEPYAPTAFAHTEDLGNFLFHQMTGTDPNGGPYPVFDFDAYISDGTGGALPLFFKFYPRNVSTPTDYNITTGSYRALMPLRSLAWSFPALADLTGSVMICGGTASQSYENGMWPRVKGAYWQDESPLPKGNGLAASRETLELGTVPDLPYLTTRFKYTDQTVADAAELLCEAMRGSVIAPAVPSTGCTPFEPTALSTEADFSQVKAYADCKAADFERSLGGLILPKIPRRVFDNLAFPAIGGQMGAQVQRLRAALIRFGDLNIGMRDAASELRETVEQMSFTVQMVGVRINQENLDQEIASLKGTQARIRLSQIDYQEQAAQAKAALDCATGLLSGIVGAMSSGGASLVQGGGDCLKAMQAADQETQNLKYERQIAEVEQTIAAIQGNREELDEEYVQLEHARDMVRQRGLVRSLSNRMSQIWNEARASFEEVNAALAEIESLRLGALRSMSRAMQFQSTQSAVTANIDAVLNAKLDTTKRRYDAAHRNAIRLAFLAKRAIEQRLGVHLSELHAPLPLVDAPATWESTICTAEGVDYAAIRNADGEGTRNYAGAYIGDYVRNLRNVVESYRLEFDFHEGTDEVVASVRDDIFGVRAVCDMPLGNLLTYSGTLDQLTLDPATPGWQIVGCPVGANGVSATCLKVARRADSPSKLNAVGGGAVGYQLTWGGTTNPPPEYLAQRVKLSPGRYRVSWFTKEVPGAMSHPFTGIEIDAALYNSSTATQVGSNWNGVLNPFGFGSVAASNGWVRAFRTFDVTTEGNYSLRLYPQLPEFSARAGAVGGVMLEALSSLDALEDPLKLRPPPYVATDADRTRGVQVCQDTDGKAFRGNAWTRRCEKLCPDGFSGGCEHTERPVACYWETSFGIDQRDLEEGVILKQAGFAKGNFNYRIEDIGVNFVGGGVRNCEDSDNPSSCYAGGFVPYSLKHMGPLFVRNHEGSDFNVKLFTGNIEHARGLALERYLTNPLSDTDRGLMAPYIRSEFRGRPLDGSLVLRVWDEPGVDFNAIQDVQLYVKYRYWTRSE